MFHGSVSINLNRGTMENNINLIDQRQGTWVAGTREIPTFASPRPLGTFELRMRSSGQ